AHLVAARELDVDARRILRARSEAGVERRLVPVEIDPLRRLAAVPRRLSRVERGLADTRQCEGEQARRERDGRTDSTKNRKRTHCRTSASDRRSFAEAVTAPLSSAASAGTFFTLSLPMNGRDWNSQSLPCEKPNSMSHGRGRPFASLAGSSFSPTALPAATISSTSFGESTSSFPLDGTTRLPPPGSSAFFHADL